MCLDIDCCEASNSYIIMLQLLHLLCTFEVIVIFRSSKQLHIWLFINGIIVHVQQCGSYENDNYHNYMKFKHGYIYTALTFKLNTFRVLFEY